MIVINDTLHKILNALRISNVHYANDFFFNGDLLSFIFSCVRFICCKYNENEHRIKMREWNMNSLITYDMHVNVYVNVCVNSRTLRFFHLLYCVCALRTNLSYLLRHHFARCQPLLHVVTEDRGDIDEHQKGTRHSECQHRSFRRTRLHDGHCFV